MIQAISVIGLGFVGLTTALGFAEKGFRVRGYDRNPARLAQLAAGWLPFHEPGLPDALGRHLGDRFQIAADVGDAVRGATAIFICVGTPSGANGAADLTALLAAVDETVAAIDGTEPVVLVIKSTVPPGTTRDVIAPALRALAAAAGKPFVGLAANPEFLREGCAWDDFLRPDRIVVGIGDDRSWALLAEAYAGFAAPIERVTPTEAEFIKYLSNTLLATLISFANEMSMIAGRVGGIDIRRAFAILHGDRRWHGAPAAMSSYAYPGCGFGGYCLPKDTQAMAQLARRLGLEAGLLEQVIATNAAIKRAAVERIAAAATPDRTIGVLGLSFKPESDDVRESPSRDIVAGLLAAGYRHIVVHDPMAMGNFAEAFGLPIDYAPSARAAVDRADVVVVATAWREYLDLLAVDPGKPIMDLRHCLKPQSDRAEQPTS